MALYNILTYYVKRKRNQVFAMFTIPIHHKIFIRIQSHPSENCPIKYEGRGLCQQETHLLRIIYTFIPFYQFLHRNTKGGLVVVLFYSTLFRTNILLYILAQTFQSDMTWYYDMHFSYPNPKCFLSRIRTWNWIPDSDAKSS